MSQSRGDVGASRHGRRLADGTWSWGQWFRDDVGASRHGRGIDAKARREAKARAKWEREAERRCRLCYAVERGGEGHDLTLAEIRTIQAIAVGEHTWTPTEALAQVGLNGSTLAGLVAGGWVEEFQTEEGELLTLSVWAVESLGLDVAEHWEVYPGIAEQTDSSGEKTRMPVREPHEVPRWATRPAPPEPGMPKPKRVPIKLPFLFRMSRLPDDVIQGMLARTITDPVAEAIENEEYKLREARTEDGRLDVDEESGKIKLEPVLLWAPEAKDGLRGGVADPHGGKIPIDSRLGSKGRKLGKKRRRKGRRPA